MSKAVKWIIGALGALVGLFIIISLCLPLFIDPNDYKSTIAQKVQEQTGRELSMPGDIKLDFSIMGLKTIFSLGDVSLSSRPEFPDTGFFSSKLVEINLALWPLITSKELKVNKVQLEGVTLNLVRSENGLANWEMGPADGIRKETAAPEDKAPAESKKEGGKGLAGIDIGAVTIKDINLSFEDRQAGRTVKLSNFNLDIGHVQEGRSFPLKTVFALYLDDGKQAPLSAKVDLDTDLTLFLAQQRFTIEGLNFKSTLTGGPVPVPELSVELAADIDLDVPKETVNIKKLVFRQGEMEVRTMLSLSGFAAPKVTGNLSVPKFSPRAQAGSLGINLPLEDPDALMSLSAEVDFSYDPSRLSVSNLQINLDDAAIKGTAEATGLSGDPAYDLTLHVDQFDLDRYKMKKADAPAGEAVSAQESGATAQASADGDLPIIPVELLRKLTFAANVKVDRLKAAKLTITNIQLNATGRDGLIQLQPFAADLYDGSINVTGDIDARPDVPKMKLTKVLQGVELGPLFTDMTGKPEIKGKANINADITTRGLTKKELTANANGNMNLVLANCEIAKLKIIDTIRTAKALLGSMKKEDKQQPAKKDNTDKTPAAGRPTGFASLTASGRITNGVFQNNDLLADSELMKVEGKGTVDLNTEQIDYLLTIHLAKSIDKNEETGLVDLADTPIPYRVKGTFDKIEQSAALEELVKSEAKKVLFKELEKQLGGDEKAKDGAKGGAKQDSKGGTEELINKGLKSLFGN